MRRAMICVSVMLAVLQLWPIVFGHKMPSTEADAALVKRVAVVRLAVPKAIPAVAMSVPPAPVTVAMAVPETCYQHYQRAFKACDVNSQSCHLGVADKWDLCEATGFWND